MFRSAVLVSLNRILGLMERFLGEGYVVRRWQGDGVKDMVSSWVERGGQKVRIDLHSREVEGLDGDDELFALVQPLLIGAMEELLKLVDTAKKLGYEWKGNSKPVELSTGPDLPPFPKQAFDPLKLDWSRLDERLNFHLGRLRRGLGGRWELDAFQLQLMTGWAVAKLSCRTSGGTVEWSTITVSEQDIAHFTKLEEVYDFLGDRVRTECAAIEESIELFNESQKKERPEKMVMESTPNGAGESLFKIKEAEDVKVVELKDFDPAKQPFVWLTPEMWCPQPDEPEKKKDAWDERYAAPQGRKDHTQIPYKMNAKETREAATVMRMQSSGCAVESKARRKGAEWGPCPNPIWTWDTDEYRLAPSKKVIKRWMAAGDGILDGGAVFLSEKAAQDFIDARGNGRIIELAGVENAERSFEHEQCWMVIGWLHEVVMRYTYQDAVSAEKKAKDLKDGVVVEMHGVRVITK